MSQKRNENRQHSPKRDNPPQKKSQRVGESWACDLYGSHSDNVRHMIVRASFLAALIEDARIQEIYAKWWNALGKSMTKLVSILDAEAAHVGLQSRRDLFDVSNVSLRPTTVVPEDLTTGDLEMDTAVKVVNTSLPDGIADDVVRLIRDELNLPWAWISFDLIQWFTGFLVSFIQGTIDDPNFVHCFELTPVEEPVPELQFEFTTSKQETRAVALRRLDDEVARVRAALASKKAGHPVAEASRTGTTVDGYTSIELRNVPFAPLQRPITRLGRQSETQRINAILTFAIAGRLCVAGFARPSGYSMFLHRAGNFPRQSWENKNRLTTVPWDINEERLFPSFLARKPFLYDSQRYEEI